MGRKKPLLQHVSCIKYDGLVKTLKSKITGLGQPFMKLRLRAPPEFHDIIAAHYDNYAHTACGFLVTFGLACVMILGDDYDLNGVDA